MLGRSEEVEGREDMQSRVQHLQHPLVGAGAGAGAVGNMLSELWSPLAQEKVDEIAASVKSQYFIRWSMLPRVERIQLMQSCFYRWLQLRYESRAMQNKPGMAQQSDPLEPIESSKADFAETSQKELIMENLRLKARNHELEEYMTEMSDNLYVVEDEVRVLRHTLKMYITYITALDQSQYENDLSQPKVCEIGTQLERLEEKSSRTCSKASDCINVIDLSKANGVQENCTRQEGRWRHPSESLEGIFDNSLSLVTEKRRRFKDFVMSPVHSFKDPASIYGTVKNVKGMEAVDVKDQAKDESNRDSSSKASGHMTATMSSAGATSKSVSMLADLDCSSELDQSDFDDFFGDRSPKRELFCLKERELIAEKCEQLRIAQESIEALQTKIARSELGRADLARRLEHAKSELQIEREKNRSLERIFGSN
eukprot:756347-Hanusia_phi.AAC.4